MALICGFFWVFRSAVGLVCYTFLRLLGYLVGWLFGWCFGCFCGFGCGLGVFVFVFCGSELVRYWCFCFGLVGVNCGLILCVFLGFSVCCGVDIIYVSVVSGVFGCVGFG